MSQGHTMKLLMSHLWLGCCDISITWVIRMFKEKAMSLSTM